MSASSEPAEYKQVTILFADVVRSMAMAETLGAERLRELMTELVIRSTAVVQRFGGTMNQFTGDGFMAVFGAPVAMEDHALRACLAALDVQAQSRALAAEIHLRDGVVWQVRIGLNSGEVVVGDVDAWPMKYTVSGQHVGLAQRMESVAVPGGVMLSESTARLVEGKATLGPWQPARIKGAREPVSAHALLGVDGERHATPRNELRLVGRAQEKAAIADALQRTTQDRGGVVGVVGAPGIGKSRLIRESVQLATSLGADVFYTYCESHTRDISFHVIARALRAAMGVVGLPPDQARAQIRRTLGDVDEQDILLLDELLGIRDVEIPMTEVSPDARRKRLVQLLNAAAVARSTPAVYVVEDVHWIDTVSEALLADLASSLSQTRSMMLVTYRPEYRGPLGEVPGSLLITLDPLDDSQSTELTTELLGDDPSVAGLAELIADRAAGVPFFAEEIVRDLAERGVLRGPRGAYECVAAVHDLHVPATLQATIGARIDRLDAAAKRTLHAAAVIGARFNAESLETLSPGAEVTPLIDAELIDHASRATPIEYAFRHPLIQKVAYDSQLRSERAKLHRRLASSIEQIDANAGVIATQWEAAGDFDRAYEWHMRAAAWFNYRDHRAARTSWQLARDVADRLPIDDPDRLSKRIAPRTFICATTFRVGGEPADTGFDELQRLTAEAGDKMSLAIGMAGYLTTLAFTSHHHQASELASEFVDLVESIGLKSMTVGLLPAAAQAKYEAGEVGECLRIADRVIRLADGDPSMGDLMVATPLAWAYTLRGTAKMCLGRPGWLADLDHGLHVAMPFDVGSRCNAALYKHVMAFQNRMVLPEAADLSSTAEWLLAAAETEDPTAITLTRLIRGVTLLHASPEHHGTGAQLLRAAHEHLSWLSKGLLRFADVELAGYAAETGDLDGAVALAGNILDQAFGTGEMFTRGSATAVLVEALLQRGNEADLAAACAVVDRLAAVPTEPGFVLHELPILRLRALIARAADDHDNWAEYLLRYRALAESVEAYGHLADAWVMSESAD